MTPTIRVAETAGFCPGVKRAVDTAMQVARDPERLAAGRPAYMLGAIVHNRQVVDELLAAGIRLAEDPQDIPDGAEVIIRAHGVPPWILEDLVRRGCIVQDQTCPYVRKIQRLAAEMTQDGTGLIIAGAADHPEVVGIAGFSHTRPVVVSSPREAAALTFEPKSWVLVAQTTFSVHDYEEIKKILQNKIALRQIFDTICSTTAHRQAEARDLASESDLVLVLGGSNSSNTRKLADVCQTICPETILVERPEQLAGILAGRALHHARIGVTAGASTPERMIREVIRIMTEQEGMQTQQEQMDVDFSEFIDSIPQLKRGTVVQGAVVRYDNDFVYVDVKDKTEGKIPRHEFDGDPEFDLDEAVENHTEMDVYVRNIRNTDQGKEILLSKARVDFSKHKNAIEEAFNSKTPVNVKVVNVVRDGVIAAFGSVDIYVHRTQLEMHQVDDLEPYKGESFDILVTQFDPDRKRLRVSGSRRALLAAERKKKSEEVWNTIEVDKVYDGVVRNLTDFGAFVDIGGVDGLVHISELSWQRIKHPSEVLSVGDHINVFVKDFDSERKRISLGYKREETDPYRDVESRFPVGSIVRGIVVRMFPFGAFVEIAPGVDALCHISQISDVRLNRPNDVLAEGMEIDARVLEVSNEARRISISIREVEPINPENYEPPQQMTGGGRRREDDGLPTAYTDDMGASSLSDIADISVETEEGAAVMEQFVDQDRLTDPDEILADEVVLAPETMDTAPISAEHHRANLEELNRTEDVEEVKQETEADEPVSEVDPEQV